MKANPYIGVTGIKSSSEAALITGAMMGVGFEDPYIRMLGIVASNKRLRNHKKGSTQGPPLDEIPGIVGYIHEHSMPTIHYYTPNQDTFADEICDLFSHKEIYEKGYCRALQLNFAWPDKLQLESILNEMPDMKIILSIPRDVITGSSPKEIAAIGREYDSLVTYALVDPSEGQGRRFNAPQCTKILLALDSTMPTTRLGIAGGISGRNVVKQIGKVRQLGFTGPLCLDSQSKIRTPDKKKFAEGDLLLYIRRSADALL